MSVFKRGKKWQYDFWVNGKRYRGSIPEARVKAQAERAEVTIRDSVYEGIYGKSIDAPKLRDFVADTFLPWSKANKRTWSSATSPLQLSRTRLTLLRMATRI